MDEESPDPRPVIEELLELLSSPEQQLQYEADVPVAFVPDELVCMWFDGHYFPDDPFFRSCFTPDELEVLAAFSSLYQRELDRLPEPIEGISTWHAWKAWSRVMDAAAATLARLRA